MKKLIIAITSSLLLFISACTDSGESSSAASGSIHTSKTESVAVSGESVDTESSEESSEVTVAPEEIYEFLRSEYILTSQSVSHGNSYVCDYYFVDGLVAGAKFTVTLATIEAANEFYSLIGESYEDAVIENMTVTYYDGDDESNYYGYTLEKLKFVLDKTNKSYTLNFDEEAFLNEFSAVIED